MDDDLWGSWNDLLEQALELEARIAKETGEDIIIIDENVIATVESVLHT